jgi:hypothetical protein
MNRQLYTATYEEIFSINDAIVRSEDASMAAFSSGNRVVVERGICAKTGHAFVEVAAGGAMEAEGHS